MMAPRSLSATLNSFFSIAVLTRLIRRLLVSPPAATQSAQMRFSTYLALSSVGAILSASNSLSMLILASPVCGLGRLAGGSTIFGSGLGPILGSAPSGGLTSGPGTCASGPGALGAGALGAGTLGSGTCARALTAGTVVRRAAATRAWNRLAMAEA